MKKAVTSKVQTGYVDGELVPLTKCICGAEWISWSGPILSIYKDDLTRCPKCKRQFYCSIYVKVYEVEE